MWPQRWTQSAAVVRGWWTDLDLDWQSVAVGYSVAAVIVLLDVRIPW